MAFSNRVLLLWVLGALGCSAGNKSDDTESTSSGGAGTNHGAAGASGEASTGGSSSVGATNGTGGDSVGSGGALGGAGGGQAPTICGLYTLDGKGGTYRDVGIRDEPYVAGYVLRLKWSEIESAQGAYDFSAVDHNLEKVVALGQSLSLNFLNHLGDAEPSYVSEGAAEKWSFTDTNMSHPDYGVTYERPVPWDAFGLERQAAALQALADHEVMSADGMVRLADHPALKGLNFGVLSLGSIRELDPDAKVEDFPGYSREAFLSGVLSSLQAQTTRFPKQSVYVGFWPITDQTKDPSLSEYLRQGILAELDGVTQPSVGFWMENLAHSNDGTTDTFRPTTQYASALYDSREQTFVGFQALTSWAKPFTGESAVAGGSPVAAANWALETFGARYFELYPSDVDTAEDGTASWTSEELATLAQTLRP